MKIQLLLLGMLSLLATSTGFGQAQTPMTMPSQNGTFSGNVRGYFFVAPSCFTITGAMVPTDASTGNQSIAIVRFNATPPAYSTTTNAFTVLFLTQNDPFSGIFSLNIPVQQGDIIGVLGQRNTENSYASTGLTTTINGQSVTLTRLGMQYPLTTTPPQELWTEAGGSISRVNLYYDISPNNNITATPTSSSSFDFTNGSDPSAVSVWNYGDGTPLDTVFNASHTYTGSGVYNVCSYITSTCGTDTVCTTVTVCLPSTNTQTLTTCFGDSVNVGSNMYNTSGVYLDTLSSVFGCDSIIETNLTVLPQSLGTQQVSICSGEVFTFNGNQYTTSGLYTDTLVNMDGCDSIVSTQLTVAAQLNTTLQVTGLTLSVPAGNQYQWIDCSTNTAMSGETSASFTAQQNGSYAVIVSNGNCSDTSDCQVINTVGLDDLIHDAFSLYPNPAKATVTIKTTEAFKYLEIKTTLGQTIYSKTVSSETIVDITKFAKGLYLITLSDEAGKSYTKELIIE